MSKRQTNTKWKGATSQQVAAASPWESFKVKLTFEGGDWDCFKFNSASTCQRLKSRLLIKCLFFLPFPYDFSHFLLFSYFWVKHIQRHKGAWHRFCLLCVTLSGFKSALCVLVGASVCLCAGLSALVCVYACVSYSSCFKSWA